MDTGSTLQVKEDKQLTDKYLTKEAQEIMGKKATGTIVESDTGLISVCEYFSLVINENNLEEGIKEISLVANKLVSEGLVHSVLAPVSYVQLARMPLQTQACVVFFYPLIFADRLDYVKANYHTYRTLEGGTGPTIGNRKLKLAPGEFLTSLYINVAAHILADLNADEILNKEIEKCLKFLPDGTRVSSITKCAIIALAVPYEVKFYNPLLTDVKKVTFDYIRKVSVVDDHLVPFNLFTGINYFDKNDNDLFSPHVTQAELGSFGEHTTDDDLEVSEPETPPLPINIVKSLNDLIESLEAGAHHAAPTGLSHGTALQIDNIGGFFSKDSSDESNSNLCTHNYQHYKGLFEEFEFCTSCGKRRCV